MQLIWTYDVSAGRARWEDKDWRFRGRGTKAVCFVSEFVKIEGGLLPREILGIPLLEYFQVAFVGLYGALAAVPSRRATLEEARA